MGITHDSRLVISLKEARKLLGKELSEKLSDEELEKLIIDLDELARLTIRGIMDGSLKIPENKKSGKNSKRDSRNGNN